MTGDATVRTSGRIVVRLVALAGALALTGVMTGCSSAGSPAGSTTAAAAAAQGQPDTRSATAPPVAASSEQPAPPSYSAQQVADPGLPSRIGAGKLTAGQVKQLLQYFEDHVNHAYATGDADELSHFLAGPMLSGNRATILLLNRQHRRNIVRVDVRKVQIDANQKRRVVVEMTGTLTHDYFVDTRSGKVLDNGLPGPSPVQFLMFLDQNPATHTWYWTGEQSDTGNSSSATGAG